MALHVSSEKVVEKLNGMGLPCVVFILQSGGGTPDNLRRINKRKKPYHHPNAEGMSIPAW